MAFNSQIKGYMTFGKSFSRGGAFPLEAYEIWTDYDALVAYAANTDPAKDPSYIGQKVAYVDIANNKVTHYSIEIDGSLKELGAATNGDGFTIDLVNGVLSLHGINDDATVAGMLPQVEVVDGKKGIKWVPISEVVEGDGNKVTTLTSSDGSVIIEATTDTDSSLVYDLKVTHPAVPVYAITSERNEDNNATIYHLTKDGKNVEKEIVVPDAYDDTALAGRVKTLEDAGYQTANDVSSAITTAIANKADKASTLAGYGITDAYTKTEVDTELAKKAAKSDFDTLKGRVDAFFEGTGVENVVDTLEDLITYINTHDDTDISGILTSIQAIENKVDTGDQKVSEYVTAAVEALKIGDYAKAADLTALAGRVETLEKKPFDDYATKSEVNAVDAKFQDVVAKSDFEDFQTENAQAIATAKQEAIDAAAEAEEAKGYAVAAEVEESYAKKATTLAGYGITDAYTKTDSYSKTEVDELINNINKGNQESAGAVSTRLETYITNNDKEVAALKEKDIAHDTAIAAAKAQADKGVNDAAAAALAVTNLTNGQVAQNKNDIDAIKNIVNGEDNENSYAKRLAKLEAHDLAHGEEYTALNTKVGENTTAIAKKADAENVYTKGEADALINAKANAAEVYTKGEVDTKVQEAIDAIPDVDFTPYAKIEAVEAIFKAGEGENPATGILAEEIARAKAAEEANAEAINALVGDDKDMTIRAIAAAETAKIVAGADTKYDTLKEIADFIMSDETGAAKMATDIAALKETVGDANNGLVKAVQANADAIAAIVQPKASTEISVATDGTLGINEMNVNKLVQTEGDTLVLNGGNADAKVTE